MTRDTMKRRKETAGVIRKIVAHDMATRKPCETALKQQGHKPFACDFKSRERANKDVHEEYTTEDCLRNWGINLKRSVIDEE